MRIRALLFCMLLPWSLLMAQSWQLVWSDEFDGDALDQSKWSYMIGTGVEYGIPDWGNNEMQYYLEENAVLDTGHLFIIAKKESMGGKAYTSARIRTIDKGDWTYCRIEFRAKMPIGKGLWAAVWMLPTDNAYGGWAASGELDIMEYLGDSPNTVHGTIHYGGAWPANQYKGTDHVLDSGDFHSSFHDFALEWEEGEIRWYVDDELYQTLDQGDWYTTGYPFPAPFNRRFHLLINLAVGGNWPGAPDGYTQFPQELVVDYVRIYQWDPEATDIDPGNGPDAFLLQQNHPNPFQRTTRIQYSLASPGHVCLELFDPMGRRVLTAVDQLHQPGRHTVEIDGAKLPPGLYTYRIRAGKYLETRQMVRY